MAKKDLRQMKKDKQRKKKKLDKEDIHEMARESGVEMGDIKKKDVRDMEKTIKEYEDKSEDELMGDLENMIRSGREDGSFSNEMLDGFMKNVAPMMNAAQRKRMEEIARMIKMNKI